MPAQPTAEQPTAEQPTGEQPRGEQPTAEAPTAEQPAPDQAKPDGAAPDAAAPDQATAEKAPGDAAAPEPVPADQATAEKPDAAKPDAAKPDADKSADQPPADAAVAEKPPVDKPAEQPAPAPAPAPQEPAFGAIERLDPALDALIAPGTKIEKLAEGFDWSEGPLWQRNGGYLLFSDVPKNVILKWNAADGQVTEFMKPSGYTGTTPRGGEPGSNGLTFDHEGRLTVCQHGDRRVVRVEPDGTWTTLADKFGDKRLNSPNDLCYDRAGNLYFTDPPYGLEGKNDDPKKELNFNGVYLLRKNGKLVLLTKGITFPNGVALSPDEKTLYVNQSDPKKPIVRAFDVKDDGTLANARVFFDATHLAPGRKGLPDGLKVDEQGNVFTTGPGGVLILSPSGKHLGTINTGEATANCNWGGDGSDLYITADMYVCRVKTKTRGKMP
jgi:gluconolactonase